MYRLREVSKQFVAHGRTISALNHVSMDIFPGEFLAVQGPTGQGKTTLLTLLGALDRPDTGEVLYQGRDLSKLSDEALTELRARDIGFVFQTFNLIATLNAQENVEAALVPLDIDARDREERASEALAAMGLSSRAQHLPMELSGGQQQRVAIARAIVKEPQVLLADEPTGNLDEETRAEILDVLMALWRERGITLVIVTHDSSVARQASRVVTIRNGMVFAKHDLTARS